MPLIKIRAPEKPLPFMRYRWVAFTITLLMTAAAIASLTIQHLELGVDFTGGIVADVSSPEPIDTGALREQLAESGFEAAIQGFNEGRGATIRLPPSESGENEQATVQRLSAAIGDSLTIEGTSALGPKVSGEFLRKSIIAVGLSMLSIAFYVWFRFEFKFGAAALLTTLHDTLMVFALFSFTRLTFDMTIVAAILTVIGYSVNDTVVVFDRIRENLRKFKAASISDIIDRSVTETLPRTVVTGGTTLLASLSLLFFGGPVLFGFAAAIVFGVIIGTYSSIFVAASLLVHLPGKLPGEADERRAAEGVVMP